MCRTQLQSLVVALNSLGQLSLLLEGIGEVAVCIGKVGLELNGSSVGINGQFSQPLLVVHAGQIAVDNGMVRTDTQCPQICHYRSTHIGEEVHVAHFLVCKVNQIVCRGLSG